MGEQQNVDWFVVRESALACLKATWGLECWAEWSRADNYDVDRAALHLAVIDESLRTFKQATITLSFRGLFDWLASACVGEGPRPDFRFGFVCCATAHEAAYELLRLALLRIENCLCDCGISSTNSLHDLSPNSLRDTLANCGLENGCGIVDAGEMHQIQAWISREWAAATRASAVNSEIATGVATQKVKAKRSTSPGEGETKLISALMLHHDYSDDGELNLEPIGNNQLARLAKVSRSTASGFFDKYFAKGTKGGHRAYMRLCQGAQKSGPAVLLAALKALNGEFRPGDFLGTRCIDESRPDRRRKPRGSELRQWEDDD